MQLHRISNRSEKSDYAPADPAAVTSLNGQIKLALGHEERTRYHLEMTTNEAKTLAKHLKAHAKIVDAATVSKTEAIELAAAELKARDPAKAEEFSKRAGVNPIRRTLENLFSEMSVKSVKIVDKKFVRTPISA